jgi:hypothetical protein
MGAWDPSNQFPLETPTLPFANLPSCGGCTQLEASRSLYDPYR